MVDQSPAATLRCLTMRGGIVAVLGSKIWAMTKAMSSGPVSVERAIMRPLLH